MNAARPTLSARHLWLALVVVAIWGTNFVVIKWGLAEFPPFLLAALRFSLSALPWIFFMPRPAVSWGRLAAFGVLLGAGQFGLLFWAMRADVTPGLASLVMQSQVFFTIGLAMLIAGERVRLAQGVAVVLAASGVALIGWHSLHEPATSATPFGLLLLLLAAAAWAAANLVVRGAGKVNALTFMVWSSPFAVPPLLLMTFAFEGPAAIAQALTHATWLGWSAVGWQAVGNMLFGFAAWNWLLARYPAATVTPVRRCWCRCSEWARRPLLLAEPLPAWKLGRGRAGDGRAGAQPAVAASAPSPGVLIRR
jgi:O-acetylserine/cysteine efflux transporter